MQAVVTETNLLLHWTAATWSGWPAWLRVRSLLQGHPRKHEAKETTSRAVPEVGQTRTWNLMIDVIAQTGKYKPNAQSLTVSDFIVEGEQRYWVLVAIDRFTGTVLGQQLEEGTE